MDCPDCFNNIQAMYCPSICGEHVIYTPFESAFCGILPMRATALCNCCGLYGVKTGEPLVFQSLLWGLRHGTADALVASLQDARSAWSASNSRLPHREVELSSFSEG
jgi:hypothetical protein